ncbi:GNAT family N-acetyltransferase [Paenibacillus sp. N1-5-1-14]|uniref:GNAT family N-acetyltransferase n=1 Tax=Paenibacillus radicibacter TaxID=2972488 RepID=UPI00215969CD|nr:GNAT family N-acetyltransferase [Paenibacillus radicibacter]MCR8644571.1 GNAT family N-acetyltransferase [Paenibacillus radicibacter]
MSSNTTNPILLEIPESFESERLQIRAPLWGDGAAINEAIRESVEELRPWMIWAQNIPSIDQSEIGMRNSRLQFLERKDLQLLLIHKETGQLIGSSGLHRIDWQARKFEIGYWVRTTFARQGYVAEAVNAITNFAIQELDANRIEIRCDSRNTNSARVAERTGFTLEGILRKEKCNLDGGLSDTMIFSKVRGIDF